MSTNPSDKLPEPLWKKSKLLAILGESAARCCPGEAKGLDQRQQIDAIALDFSKAFDKVPHQKLAAKLKYHGVRGKTLRWIERFLSGRIQ